MTMPSTYASERAKRRERRPSLCMAKKPTVIGIIGKTHGVRFRASPPRKRISSVNGSPCSAYAAERRSLPIGTAAEPLGAAESGVNPAAEVDVVEGTVTVDGATTFVSIVTSTSRGGRHTLSLHA